MGSVGQHGQVQPIRRQHGDFGQTKVRRQVGGGRFSDDLRMPYRVRAIFIDPGVQGGKIQVLNRLALVWFGGGVQGHGFGASSVERVPGF